MRSLSVRSYIIVNEQGIRSFTIIISFCNIMVSNL